MVMTEGSDLEQRQGRRTSDRIGVALVTLVALSLLSAPIYGVLSSRSNGTAASPAMNMGDTGGAPVDIETLQPVLAELYIGARSHRDHFEEIPCFCGCEEGRLEHRNLFDCYVLKDGRGWESHATGCAVCQGEARLTLKLLDANEPFEDIRARIIDEFGLPQEIRDLQEG